MQESKVFFPLSRQSSTDHADINDPKADFNDPKKPKEIKSVLSHENKTIYHSDFDSTIN